MRLLSSKLYFPMRAGEQPASQVTYEWLMYRQTPSKRTTKPEQQIDELRSELESLASSKYDSGDFVLADGLVIVKIRTGD
jgi:hypothetical protein